MTRDLETLRMWLRVVVIMAAICATAVPVIYAFCPWRTSLLGKLFMNQAVALAVAIDMNVLFFVWRPTDPLVLFWIWAIAITGLAVSTALMAIFIWRTNLVRKRVFWVLLSDKTYQVMKRIVQVGLPGVGTLYFTLAQIWDLAYGEEVVGTVTAVNLFLGLLLGISTKTYNESPLRYDGTLAVVPHEEQGTSTLRMLNVDLEALAHKQEITFKVIEAAPVNSQAT